MSCGSNASGITACTINTQPAVNGTGSIEWDLTGQVYSNAIGTVLFRVRIE